MRVFVTGGNGFVGSRVVRALAAQGHPVRCLLRPQSRTHRIDRVAYERHPGDILDELTLQSAGMKKFVLQLPNGLIKAMVKALAFLRLPTPVLPDLLDYATRFWWMSSAKAEAELGYRSRSAKEAVADVVRWLQQTGRV